MGFCADVKLREQGVREFFSRDARTIGNHDQSRVLGVWISWALGMVLWMNLGCAIVPIYAR